MIFFPVMLLHLFGDFFHEFEEVLHGQGEAVLFTGLIRFGKSECDLANLHYQLPSNEDNLVHLLEDPENWSTICRFFNQLEVEI
jgi:hypothetical protein